MAPRVNWYGIVIAVLGFTLTRFTVTLALAQDPIRFVFAGVVPMGLGLGLAAFGVALAVADVDPSAVRTTARWCVLGTGAMLVLAVLTVLGANAGSMPPVEALRSQAYLSNFLIGGSVGGTFTGLYAARNRRDRTALEQQTRRLVVLNRVLRHEVLNAVNVIQGYADRDRDHGSNSSEVIRRHSGTIEATVEEVKYLTQGSRSEGPRVMEVDLGDALQRSLDEVRSVHPDATIELDGNPTDVLVRASDRLDRVFTHLLDNAVVHAPGSSPTVRVSLSSTARTIRIGVHDQGPGLPDQQRRLLETGEIWEFDDPGTGFGLNVVRLLVESYGGRIETAVSDDGSTVTVELDRVVREGTGFEGDSRGLAPIRPETPQLVVTFSAALIAGFAYGAASWFFGGSIAAIGIFYGDANPVVGWLTHEFHSVVFAFMFAGIISYVPIRYRHHIGVYAGIGLLWGTALWIGAAGIIAPIWLQLLGYSANLPSLTLPILVSHLVWGATLGVFVAFGYTFISPWLAENVPSLTLVGR